MRLSNKNKAPVYNFIHTFILVCTLLGFIGFFLDHYKLRMFGWKAYFFIIIPVIALIIFYWRGRQIFEYDSDGEALNFKNRSVIPFMAHAASDEFPKYKLLKYEVVNAIIFKKLYITISSKKSHSLILKYDISYLTTKEIKDLKISLNRVVKANKDNKQQEREVEYS